MNATPFEFIHPVPPSIIRDTECPLFESMVSAGFPSPAQDYYDGYLNLIASTISEQRVLKRDRNAQVHVHIVL